MILTQRRSVSEIKELKMYGRNFQVKDTAMYLDATLNTKLTFKFPLETIIIKATGAGGLRGVF